MIETAMISASDMDLVSESLSGNRDAFGKIVARYQNLICSVAYSATGNLATSEDLAQETFVTAWKQLAGLREPEKLRPWLCGIARNLIHNSQRRQSREPSHRAESLDEISESRSAEPLPHERAITNEEAEILWRALERIPEIYREPLVLFYREHQSIPSVALHLELTEDTVKQRLSRGRKLLNEQVLAFVEDAITRTNPGKVFTVGVLATLPALTFSAKAATVGATAAKGSATAKTAGTMLLLTAVLGPLVVILQNYLGYRVGLAAARSEDERGRVRALFRSVGIITLGIFIPFAAVVLWLFRHETDRLYLAGLLATGLALIYLPVMLAFCITSARKSRATYAGLLAREHAGIFPKPAWEYRSQAILFGLPLVHIRFGDRFSVLKEPVRAWIAVGHRAIGGLFAFGCIAVAPVSIGGISAGLLSFGAVGAGVFVLAGIGLGVWTFFAGLAIGWQAVGCLAVAWSGADGSVAFAHDFALGHFARATQANNDLARQFLGPNLFFRCGRFIGQHWLWLNLLWLVPFLIQWLVVARARRR